MHYRRWQRHGDAAVASENWVPLVDETPYADEQWLPVVGYEGHYEVSDYGRVRSLDRNVTRSGSRTPVLMPGRLKRCHNQPDGRPSVNLARDGEAQTHLVPTLVLTAFVGPRPEGMDGCHNDGNAFNNHVDNLRWDTRSANCFDRVRHGRDHKRNRTHCPRGHRLAAPNLVACTAKRGHRSCLACNRARVMVRTAALRGEALDLQAESDAKYVDIMGSEAAA